MPSSFDITLATNTVNLDNNRQGLVAFTVRNNLHQRVHAELRVTVQPPNALNWLTILPADPTSIDPVNVRDFPVDSTQQIQVRIAAPADAPPGSYTLKLTVADEVNPDDNFTNSPDATFTIQEVPKPAPIPFPTWIIPAVLIGILVIVVIVLVASRNLPPPTPTLTPTPTLPNLVAGNVILNPAQPFCSEPFNIQFDVANLGAAATPNTGLVTVVDSLAPGGGPLISTSASFPIIQPGQTTQVNLGLLINFGGGLQHNLTLMIDPNNQVSETNEADNQRIFSFVLIPLPFFPC